jgi:hypothetical protein
MKKVPILKKWYDRITSIVRQTHEREAKREGK